MTPAERNDAAIGGTSVRMAFARRMHQYLQEMYPTALYLPLAILLYLDLSWLTWRSVSPVPMHRNGVSLIGIASIYLIGLTARMMDELKDADIDRRLFPQRPLPSGRVRASDLELGIALAIGVYLAINLGVGPIHWVAGLILGYAFLTYRHFFLRRHLERSILLTLLTHAPLLGLTLAYAAAMGPVEAAGPGAQVSITGLLLPVSMCWTMIEGVEIARKLRAPEHESAYVTYSKEWGMSRAVLVAAGLQAWTVVAGGYLAWRLSLGALPPAALVIGYACVVWGYVNYLRQPAAWSRRVKRGAELYVALVLLAFAISQAWSS